MPRAVSRSDVSFALLISMALYAFRILNVFAQSTFGGNPLCVFEDGRGLDTVTMQALALQFNLSETTFILPSETAQARVRVFTTGYEMPFAGHPTLGSAHVARRLLGLGDAFTLEFKAGLVKVKADGDNWRLTAPHRGVPKITPAGRSDAEIAALMGLDASEVLPGAAWVDTGVDQFVIPLRSFEAVARAAPSSDEKLWPQSSLGRKSAYIFAIDPADASRIVCRYFFTKSGGGVVEDPGTGSACANLGGWFISQKKGLPFSFHLEQGDLVDRACRLTLDVDSEGLIEVGGKVIEIGRGTVDL